MMRPRLGPLLAAVALACAGAAVAQELADEARALTEAKQVARAAERRSARFEAAARKSTDEALKVRARADAILARIQAARAEIDAANARIRMVEMLRARQRDRLGVSQAPLVRLTAAMQTMARRPPILAMTQRGSIDDLAHVRALLGAALPVIQQRTAGLRAEIIEAERLRTQAVDAAATLAAGRERLARERTDLALLERTHLDASLAATNLAIRESDLAVTMGERARDIVDEMRDIEGKSEVRRRLAALPDPLVRPIVPGVTAAAPPARRRAVYRLPVEGEIVTGLGEISDSGVRARGLTVATRAGADVVAPAPGRVVYAAPFRSYGEVVIIDHGGGFSSLVTGLTSSAVPIGSRVAAGDTLGRTGSQRPQVTIELRHNGRPIDIARLIAG